MQFIFSSPRLLLVGVFVKEVHFAFTECFRSCHFGPQIQMLFGLKLSGSCALVSVNYPSPFLTNTDFLEYHWTSESQ